MVGRQSPSLHRIIDENRDESEVKWYVLRRHLRAQGARSVATLRSHRGGTVGYADRSARCVSPPYALLPFLPPKRIAEGTKAISPDIWRETL